MKKTVLSEEKAAEAARAIQREYMRRWRKENPEKVRAINRNYWIRRAMRELEEQKRKEANNG